MFFLFDLRNRLSRGHLLFAFLVLINLHVNGVISICFFQFILTLLPLTLLSPSVAVHHAGFSPRLLPGVVELHQTCYRFIRKHLLDSMKSFPVKTKGLLKQDFIFHSPLIWEGGKVGQISQ